MTAVYRYRYTFDTGDYATVFMDEDGAFSIVSSWGNYGYYWPQPGRGSRSIREFVAGADFDYMVDKLSYSWPEVYDAERTEINIRYEAKRAGVTLDLDEFDLSTEEGFNEFCSDAHHILPEPWACMASKVNPEITALCRTVLPVLQEELKLELTIEQMHADKGAKLLTRAFSEDEITVIKDILW